MTFERRALWVLYVMGSRMQQTSSLMVWVQFGTSSGAGKTRAPQWKIGFVDRLTRCLEHPCTHRDWQHMGKSRQASTQAQCTCQGAQEHHLVQHLYPQQLQHLHPQQQGHSRALLVAVLSGLAILFTQPCFKVRLMTREQLQLHLSKLARGPLCPRLRCNKLLHHQPHQQTLFHLAMSLAKKRMGPRICCPLADECESVVVGPATALAWSLEIGAMTWSGKQDSQKCCELMRLPLLRSWTAREGARQLVAMLFASM
mmetsp:Transcript_73583/g.185978  ORF Transcript_73583/g.185978 Transcript_73583/m.185978 type:complete len:256 (-) Transcript_73583:135-902(-)